MKRLLIAAMLLLPTPALANPYEYTVTRVVDGDSVRVAVDWLPEELGNDISIRVIGIDTPEKGSRAQCPAEAALGDRATEFARSVLHPGDVVTVEIVGWDKYGGRIDGRIFINGESFGDMQIAAGLAKPYDGGTKESWCQ
jgi:micrococcal nuclease